VNISIKVDCKSYDCVNRYTLCENCICNKNAYGDLFDNYEVTIEEEKNMDKCDLTEINLNTDKEYRIMNRLQLIKRKTEILGGYASISMDDIDWLIEQVDKIEEFEHILKERQEEIEGLRIVIDLLQLKDSDF
jgi:hypothetical protein